LCYDNWYNRVWLFGGYDGSTYYNDLWYFDLDTKEWIKVQDNINSDNTQIPAPRANMDIEFVQGYIYLIGGSTDIESFNDFWRYDIANNRWEKIQLIDKIPFGTTYKLFRYRDRLWLFNGSVKGIYRYFNEASQFVLQPIYEELNDKLKELQKNNVFLEFPIQIQCMEEVDRLYIWSGNLTSLNYLIIDLRDKRVIGSNFTNPVIPKNRIFWLTPSYYIVADTKTEAYLGFYNVSEFSTLT
ncbi:Kelch repeat-containing protein, partial [Nocardia mangyaensis]|uniref:Kelch repeat-containing protein n=1 Tax=Nocardia mangyaensis TaxID=2213200 RepID=UPI0026753748